MSGKPVTKKRTAQVKNRPLEKMAVEQKFTTKPRKVRRFGLIPVAASAPTILSSSHLLPLPIAAVKVAMGFGSRKRRAAQRRPRASYTRPALRRKQAALAAKREALHSILP